MKIRTDFVTNSSSDSFASIVIDNLVLLEILQRYKELGVFEDARPLFKIGLGYGDSKTPAFFYEESSFESPQIVDGCVASLDKVLTGLIYIMDVKAYGDDNYGPQYYNADLYDQMKEELQQRENEINTEYISVYWYFSEDNGEGYSYTEKFTYDPENGEKHEYHENIDEEEDDEDENSDEGNEN